ncbi:MAG: DUF2231 domain-containing protein [Planctomycetota bacterium]|jgi:predicted heme/steroid binding protein/uncharacterized membrane protein
MEELSREGLEDFNGKDGRSAYAAVDGKVFDLSSSDLWKGGEHMGQHAAGRDLTEAIAGAPHGKEVLERVKQVGVLKAETASAVRQPPEWALKFLKLHPHPISVHFPQALFTFAPLFLILFYLFGNPHFERTGFYLLVAGWITSIPAFKTGIFHWVYKHGKSTKGLYLFKLCASIVLIIYGAVVIYVHYTRGILPPESVDVVMLILYLLLLPIIVAIGHAGGKIVFG